MFFYDMNKISTVFECTEHKNYTRDLRENLLSYTDAKWEPHMKKEG